MGSILPVHREVDGFLIRLGKTLEPGRELVGILDILTHSPPYSMQEM
jgi:hypothetical protein